MCVHAEKIPNVAGLGIQNGLRDLLYHFDSFLCLIQTGGCQSEMVF